MKDFIEIKRDKIIIELSFTIKEKDNVYIGYIPSLDIPFTSPTRGNAGEIATGLIRALFKRWLSIGGIKFFEEKLKKFNFVSSVPLKQVLFEHTADDRSIRIKEEVYVN